MIREQLEEAVVSIVIRASKRGPGGYAPTRQQASEVLDALVASDEAPEWAAVLFGESQLRAVVGVLRATPAGAAVDMHSV